MPRVVLPSIAVSLTLVVSASAQLNQLTDAEKSQGWVLLFDGKTFANWVDPSQLSPPGDAWSIDDGALKAQAHPRIGEDLVSSRRYRDFELMFDWRISPGGNSGVKYRIQDFAIQYDQDKTPFIQKVNNALRDHITDRAKIAPGQRAHIYVVGFEYQVIDNQTNPDVRGSDKHASAALYDVLAPTSDVTRPVGNWNHSRIVLRGNAVEHWLNGVKVVDGRLDGPEVQASVAKRWGQGSPVYEAMVSHARSDCPISLQNHDDEAWFRNIKIREIPSK